ncbi:PD-(D/E)XK nuclease family protein [Nocardioides flavescens]|uniref:DUF2800 domain-containing protein n=1 Tax=Nocardioides flavescens TaxID=2691959 RepID=A0A6L7ETA1_9ACTN|nr:DUF2800 domain-containing protein [Nocardioides flavescens]
MTTTPASLSPSRAGDFVSCPLLFRYRTVDRLPETSSPDAVRGTLVHQVLEDVFDLPAAERTPERAHALLEPAWAALRERSEEAREVAGRLDEVPWLASAHEAVERWFTLEDPTRLEPAERESYVEAELASGLRLRGIIDRLDATPDGALRVVDYKTGKVPAEGYEARVLFQLRLYALILWRSRGVVAKRLQLVYLGGEGQVLTYDPDEADLVATERKVEAIWAAIQEALRTGEFEPRRGKQCDWCPHQAICPAWGGTALPWPVVAPTSASAGPLARLRAGVRRAWRRVRGRRAPR